MSLSADYAGISHARSCNKISNRRLLRQGGRVRVTGVPTGLGEPVLKTGRELGRMLGIAAVKGVEVGAGFAVKDMTELNQ
jgi:hypothetical protein